MFLLIMESDSYKAICKDPVKNLSQKKKSYLI